MRCGNLLRLLSDVVAPRRCFADVPTPASFDESILPTRVRAPTTPTNSRPQTSNSLEVLQVAAAVALNYFLIATSLALDSPHDVRIHASDSPAIAILPAPRVSAPASSFAALHS